MLSMRTGAPLAQAALVALLCVMLYSGAALGATETFFGPCDLSNCSTRVGQVVVGGFFPLHEWNYANNSCSANFQPEGGFQRMEAMRWAMERYRGDLDVGYDLRDSCSKDTNTRDEALDYINVGTNCQTRYRNHPISLVIGASSSEVSSDLASLLALFDVPQISYAATSNELNETANRDQARFSKFFRTVPPDRFQVDAMISLIEHFEWKFVSVVYSKDLYGESAFDWLKKESMRNVSFCLAGTIAIDLQIPGAVEAAVLELQRGLVNNSKVVIVIGHGVLVRQFFKQVSLTLGNNAGERIWIASDAWSSSTPVASSFPNLTEDRVISFQPFTETFPDFEQHLCCTPYQDFPNGTRQTWYKSYFDYLFGVGNYSGSTTAKQSRKFNIDANVPFVIRAVQIGLQAVNRTILNKCNRSSLCPNATSGNGALMGAALTEVLMHTDFKNTFDPRTVQYGNDSRTFLHTTGEKFRYTIHFYRSDGGGGGASFVKVGDWKSTGKKLNLTDTAFMARFKRLKSYCANACALGSVRRNTPQFRPGCCWSCDPCKQHHIASNNTCTKCMAYQTDNGKRTDCMDLEHQYLKWGDALSVVMIVMTAVAVIITTFTIAIFYKNWETPLVRASSRELTICLFVGFYVGCGVAIVFITKPTFVTCILRRFGLGFSLTLCLSALLVKTNRISRVFSREPGHSRPAYVGQWWQIAFTCGLTLIQVLICIVWLVVQPAAAIVFVTTENVNVQLKCKEGNSAGFFVSLLYILVLMVVNTIYGFRTRKIPENFNEARYISFSMYTICTVWVGSIPAYFAANVAFESGLLGLPLVISILSMVGFLFVPKLYVILFDPARNTRHNLRPESTQNKSRSRGRSSNNTGTGTGTGGSTPGSGSGGGGGSGGGSAVGGSQSGKPRARTNL